MLHIVTKTISWCAGGTNVSPLCFPDIKLIESTVPYAVLVLHTYSLPSREREGGGGR